MTDVQRSLVPLSEPERWRAALDGIEHSFGHTWESCYAMHLSTGWRTYLYRYENGPNRVICPIAERHYHGELDVVTPYGFSGFVGTGDCPEMLSHWRELARSRGYVCGYLGLSPYFHREAFTAGEVAYEQAELFVLDLRSDEVALFDALATNRRREVRTWRRNHEPLIQDNERLSAFFLHHYADFINRRGAAPVYGFRRETLEHLVGLDNTMLVGAGRGGEVEAVALFAWTPYAAEYLLAASIPGAEHYSTGLIWEAALALQRRGVPFLNLGGGVRRGDGIAEFKRRFGGLCLPFRSLKQVYDDNRFTALAHHVGADPTDRIGYFPPYHRP